MMCPICGREILLAKEIPLGGSLFHRMYECCHCELEVIFSDQYFAYAQTFGGKIVDLSEDKIKELEVSYC